MDGRLDKDLFWLGLDKIDEDLLLKMVTFAKPIHEFFSTPSYMQLPKNRHTQATELSYIIGKLPLTDKEFVKCLLKDCSLVECANYGFGICGILECFVEKLLSDQSYFMTTVADRGEVFKIENASKFLRDSFAQSLNSFFSNIPTFEKLSELLAIARRECQMFSGYVERSADGCYLDDGFISQIRRHEGGIPGSALFRGWLWARTQEAMEQIKPLKEVSPLSESETAEASNGGLACWHKYAPYP